MSHFPFLKLFLIVVILCSGCREPAFVTSHQSTCWTSRSSNTGAPCRYRYTFTHNNTVLDLHHVNKIVCPINLFVEHWETENNSSSDASSLLTMKNPSRSHSWSLSLLTHNVFRASCALYIDIICVFLSVIWGRMWSGLQQCWLRVSEQTILDRRAAANIQGEELFLANGAALSPLINPCTFYT